MKTKNLILTVIASFAAVSFVFAEGTGNEEINNSKNVSLEITKNIDFNNAFNTVFNLENESFIDDIPFNTKEIVNTQIKNNSFEFSYETFQMEQEPYINDIPFDTEKIAGFISK